MQGATIQGAQSLYAKAPKTQAIGYKRPGFLLTITVDSFENRCHLEICSIYSRSKVAISRPEAYFLLTVNNLCFKFEQSRNILKCAAKCSKPLIHRRLRHLHPNKTKRKSKTLETTLEVDQRLILYCAIGQMYLDVHILSARAVCRQLQLQT